MNTLKKRIHEKIIQYRTAQEDVKKETESLAESKENLTAYEEAQIITQDIAQQIQEQAHVRIARVVSLCLETIFDDPYYFQIHFERKRGKTEAKLVFERNGKEVDPMLASGGGAVEVAAFALRLACILLSRPKLRPVMFLDEPFKNVSRTNGYLQRIPEMLIILAEEFGVQFIMVTHIDELKIGTIVELE